MCIKNFIGEKIIFDKFTAFFNLDIFQPSLIYNTAGSAYFMKSSPPSAFIVLFEFFAHLFQIYFRCARRILMLNNLFLTNLQLFLA